MKPTGQQIQSALVWFSRKNSGKCRPLFFYRSSNPQEYLLSLFDGYVSTRNTFAYWHCNFLCVDLIAGKWFIQLCKRVTGNASLLYSC